MKVECFTKSSFKSVTSNFIAFLVNCFNGNPLESLYTPGWRRLILKNDNLTCTRNSKKLGEIPPLSALYFCFSLDYRLCEWSEWVNTLFTLGLYSIFIVANISEHYFPTTTLSITTKTRPQHRELHALLFTIKVWVFFTSPANHNIEDAGDGRRGGLRFTVLIREDQNVWPFADIITKAALSPRLF